ncbi:MAG TPA: discoidin domain-containing protein [Polyangiaceae bacterium]|nr:discoidin domain-containing protein [Polyangiaceae bacterium]
MSTGEPESTAENQIAVTSKPASLGKRILEWFWSGSLAEEARRLPELGARATTLAHRGQSSADLAQSSTEIAHPAEVDQSAVTADEPSDSLAEPTSCELYRQSAYWALCALASSSDENAGTSYDESIWDTLDEQLLLTAASADRALPLRNSLRGSFVYFAELPPVERLALSLELRKLSELLLAKVNARSLALAAVFWRRVRRFSLLLLLLLSIAAIAIWERSTHEARHDLADGKPWQTSSKLQPACASPAQTCTESPEFFFHTLEEKDPTIEFDLGTVQQVSSVRVDNRSDCCSERAVPLFVELSEDHKRWRTVTRQEADFKTWHATFAPQKARWVRLRAHRLTFLHLARVRILP